MSSESSKCNLEAREDLTGGTELKLLGLEAFLYVPVINTGVCIYSGRLFYYYKV